jgi:hypothetical protein
MGHGYWILIWDGWGIGLTMLNPRLLSDGTWPDGTPKNWFPTGGDDPRDLGDGTILPRHGYRFDPDADMFVAPDGSPAFVRVLF